MVDVPDLGDVAADAAGLHLSSLVHAPDTQDRFADIITALVPRLV
ncbi:hypothetical protein [Kitasatospora camelliae]|uniref:Uncharacterized protein n=1 Tax=Kitasatospora camelliae TaxID=3156397 RepID=A0AAU8JQX9_9ACTN